MLHVFFRLHLPLAVGAYGSLQLLIQPWICAPGTHYGWVDRGSVEYEVCLTLLHMASTGNRTPDLLILSPMPYPLGHMPHVYKHYTRVIISELENIFETIFARMHYRTCQICMYKLLGTSSTFIR